ncbi:MAG TPA: phage holin family protein, partial [Vicinamibacterales bacterium]|nr:phage holin family protein [Vicinamibacterales bacterium]
ILGDVQEILRSEIRLARTEVREEATRAAASALWLAAGTVIVLSSWIFLLWTGAFALSTVVPMWIATLVVAVVAVATAICGGMLIVVGVRRIKRVTPVPDRTIDSLKENLEWLKQPTK